MKSSASKIKMTSFDDLFGSNDKTVCSVDTVNTIQDIEVSKLSTFANHPFKVLDDEKMEETKVSMTVIKCKKTAVKFCSFMAAAK